MYTDTINALIKLAHAHNKAINDYINIDLRAKYGDRPCLADWFKIQNDIREQQFYERGMLILKALRENGIDCKMNMQSNELVCPEIGLNY